MTPEQEARYAMSYGSRDDLKSDEARDAYDRLTAARPVHAPVPQLHAVPAPGRPRTALHAGRLVTAVIVLIAGIVLQSVTGSHAALCNSGIGQFAQGLSSRAYADCSLWTGLHSFGTWLFWIGLIGTVGLGILVAVERSRPAQP